MKEGWKIVKLGEVCEKITDGSHNPPKGIEHSNYFMLSSQNVQDGYLLMDSVRYLSKEDFELVNKRTKAQKGDILLTIVGTIGRTCVLTGNEGNITFQRSVALMKPIKAINSYYLMYYFLYQNKDLNLKANGAAQKGIYLKQLIQYPVILPPLEEQHRIVSILDASFEKIDALKKNAEENLKNAKALFQQVLAQELKHKEGWVEKKLGEICEITSSKRIFKNEYTENGIPFYRTKELKELAHGRNISLELFISETRYNDIKAKFGVPQIGDILISAVGTIGETLIIDNVNPFYFKDGNIVWLRKINGVNSNFLKISIDSIVEKLKSITRGAAYNALTIEKLKEMQITYPILEEEQINILSTIQTLSEKCRRLEQVAQQTIRECDALKQSILRQAFSGEL